MRTTARCAFAGAACLLFASTARADDEPKRDARAAAQQLFDSALGDAEAGNYASACPKFAASQAADPKTSTLLNLGSCYERNGQTASAWGAFREAEGLARKAARADWEGIAHEHAEALEPKLLRLTIDVPAEARVSGLAVTRDGVRTLPGEWGVAIPVDPGEHVVAASADGRLPWDTTIRVQDATNSTTVPVLALAPVALVAIGPPLPPPPAQEAPPPRARSWWTPLRSLGVAAAGVGAAGILTGVVLGFVANGEYGDARGQCTSGGTGCPAGAVRDANHAYDLATAATVAFVAGGVLAVAGGALVVIGGPRQVSVTARW